MKHQNIKLNSSYAVFSYSITGFLLLATLISGIILASPKGYADTSVTRNSTVSVNVNNACTMTGGSSGTTVGDSTYSATINPGQRVDIDGSKLTVICNDMNGYSVYAIGYSGNSYDTSINTKLLGAGSIGNIDTGTSTTGSTSSWAMKLSTIDGTTPPQILNNFNEYQQIPSNFTQIFKYASNTTSIATGAQIQVQYQVYIASGQIAGTYTGKVKYVMIHPNTEIPPTVPSTLDAIAAAGGTHYMQDSIDCTNSTVGTKVTLTDSRDGQTYQVAKAADGNCWMIDNLKLGKTIDEEGESITLTELNSNTNGPYTLNYSDIPTDGTFHAYTIDGTPNQNNSNEWICRNDWDSCYYNWYTATAGAGTSYKTSGNVDTSICPAGWSLPTQPQFSGLYNKYNSAALMEVDNPTTTKNNSAGKIPGFLLGGNYRTDGADRLGSVGGYWSRTAFSAQVGYYLWMNTSSVNPANNYGGKYFGFAVRCVLQQ